MHKRLITISDTHERFITITDTHERFITITDTHERFITITDTHGCCNSPARIDIQAANGELIWNWIGKFHNWENIHQLSKELTSLGIMGEKFRATLKCSVS